MEQERWVITSHVHLRRELAADYVYSVRGEAKYVSTESANFVLREATRYLVLTASSNAVDEIMMILAATGTRTGPREGPILLSGAAESSSLTLTQSLKIPEM